MVSELFADTVGRVELTGGMIRIELTTVEPTDEGAPPVMAARQRVIMPIDGFLSALATLNGLAEKLAEAGVIRRVQQGAPQGAGANGSVQPAPQPGGSKPQPVARPMSPNFG